MSLISRIRCMFVLLPILSGCAEAILTSATIPDSPNLILLGEDGLLKVWGIP